MRLQDTLIYQRGAGVPDINDGVNPLTQWLCFGYHVPITFDDNHFVYCGTDKTRVPEGRLLQYHISGSQIVIGRIRGTVDLLGPGKMIIVSDLHLYAGNLVSEDLEILLSKVE